MKRIVFFTNTPAPYKVDFFEKLGENMEFIVFYEILHSSSRKNGWENYEAKNYNPVFMKGYFIKDESAFCPEIIKHIKKYKDDIIIMMGYSSLTAIMAINYMILHKIPYYLCADGAFIPDKESSIKRTIKKRLISNASAWISSGNLTNRFFMVRLILLSLSGIKAPSAQR